MKKHIVKPVAIWILTIMAPLCYCAVASGAIVRQTIANNTGSDANDLVLKFTSPRGFGAPPLVKGSDVKITPKGNNATLKQKPHTVKSNNDQQSADFAQDTFGTIESGNTQNEMANIDFSQANNGSIDEKNSYWTLDGNNVGGVTVVGRPMRVTFLPGPGGIDTAVATLDNPLADNVTLLFSSIALYKDNDMANFNLDEFTQPTGTLVSGIPTSITLQPGESSTFDFGTINPLEYELALAEVALSSDPSRTFDLATADAVPEPCSYVLVGTGLLCLLGYDWRQRKKVA